MWRAENAELKNLLFVMRKMQSRLFCARIEEIDEERWSKALPGCQ